MLTIIGFDGEWARVDLENDGLVDGHVLAAFLGSADPGDPDEGMEEPADGEMPAEAARAGGAGAGRRRRAK